MALYRDNNGGSQQIDYELCSGKCLAACLGRIKQTDKKNGKLCWLEFSGIPAKTSRDFIRLHRRPRRSK